MRTFENIPALLQTGEGRAQWEARRRAMVDTVANIEYGCRPEMEYTVSWKLTSRETVLEGAADRLLTDITVTTRLGSHTFPLYTFLPKGDGKVPATLLICSQARVLAPQKMPEGFSMDDLPKLFAKMNIVMDGPMDLNGPRRALDMAVDMDNGHWPVPMMMERGHAVSGFHQIHIHPGARCGIFHCIAQKIRQHTPSQPSVRGDHKRLGRCGKHRYWQRLRRQLPYRVPLRQPSVRPCPEENLPGRT